MSYENLDAVRLMAIVKAMNRIAAAPLDPEEVANVAASEVKALTGASRASLEHDLRGAKKRVLHGELEGAGTSISVPVECGGAQIGLLTVAREEEEAFDQADIESLRLMGECISSLLCNSIKHADVATESRVDRLTGIGNVTAFEERVGWELSRAVRYEEPLSLVMFQIDDFGAYTDRVGVRLRDRMLSDIGKTLSEGRAADSCFRVGIDHFAMILPNTAREGAEIAAMRLAWAIANLRDDDRAVTVSTGVMQAEDDDPSEFVAGAEAAVRRSRDGVHAEVSA